MVQTYRLMMVVNTKVDISDDINQKKVIEKMVGTDGVVIKTITNLGKKMLAYEQKKNTEGQYLMVHLEAAVIHTGDLEKRVRLDENILSYLLTQGLLCHHEV